MIKFLRVGGYLFFLVIMAFLIEYKKKDIRDARKQEVVSILSEQTKKGLPVGVEKVKKGDFRSTYRTTVSLENKEKRLVNFYVNRNKLKVIKPGQQVFYSPLNEVVGEVVKLSKTPDLETGMYKGLIKVNREPKAKDGVRFVEIITDLQKEKISVPTEALSYEGSSAFLWRDQSGKAVKQHVKVGRVEASRSEIVKGLEPGDLIVINGFKYLKEGSSLNVRSCNLCESEEKND